MTTSIVLLGLVAVWGAYLAVWWRDNRATIGRRPDMIGSFNRGLDSLGNSAGSAGTGGLGTIGLRPRSSIEAAVRRRLILKCLAGVALTSLLLVFVLGSVAVLVNILADIALGSYGYAVVQRRNLEAEREMKVTMLHAGSHEADNVIELRATAGV